MHVGRTLVLRIEVASTRAVQRNLQREDGEK